jgi:hypothetical protein
VRQARFPQLSLNSRAFTPHLGLFTQIPLCRIEGHRQPGGTTYEYWGAWSDGDEICADGVEENDAYASGESFGVENFFVVEAFAAFLAPRSGIFAAGAPRVQFVTAPTTTDTSPTGLQYTQGLVYQGYGTTYLDILRNTIAVAKH